MQHGHRQTVAVVDDDQGVRESLRFLLETAGFDVDTFNSACEFLTADPVRDPDCLLIDQHMPRLTGLDLLSRLRGLGKALPVAIMTGSPSPDLVRRAEELGALTVLEKPLAEDVLMSFLDRAAG